MNELPADHYAVTYIRDRRFHNPQYLSDAFGVSFCLRADDQYRPAQNRIIAPVWQHGVLVGWQGRYPDDIDWKVTGIPKYYTRPGMHKSKILHNLDNAKLRPFVVVVEGVTSVWRIGGPAVACFSKSISGGHHSLIYEHWAGKPVLLVLDPDARGRDGGDPGGDAACGAGAAGGRATASRDGPGQLHARNDREHYSRAGCAGGDQPADVVSQAPWLANYFSPIDRKEAAGAFQQVPTIPH